MINRPLEWSQVEVRTHDAVALDVQCHHATTAHLESLTVGGSCPVMVRREYRRAFYALRIKGEFLAGAGYHHGDIAIMRRTSLINSGDLAELYLPEDDISMLCYVYVGDRVIERRLACDEIAPRVIEADLCRIKGKMVGVIRAPAHPATTEAA